MIGKNQAAPETPTPGAPGRHQDHNGGRRFAYDAAGERLVERAGSEYTLTLRRWDHKVIRQVKASWLNGSWSWEKDWVWGAGSVLATIGAREGLQQVVVDHQGSVGLVANRCGQRVAELAANPWGLDIFSTTQNPERHRYTGHLRDVHLADRSWDDFDYMHARSYFPYTGRFLSVDPGRDYDFSHPQSFNLYTYVRNNSLRYVDPDGKDAIDFVHGLVNAFGSNMLLGAGRQTPLNTDYAAGQAAGDVLAVVVGTAEAAVGMGGTASGVALSATGVAAPVGVPAAAVSTAMVLQGVGGAITGGVNLVKFATGKTPHGDRRQAEARSGDPHRQVGDPNRVVREGQKYTDRDTGNTVYVKGNRVVTHDSQGNLVSQFKNSRRNTKQRIEDGRWIPDVGSSSGGAR